nr:cuticle protein 7-like [Penaeus vannamei]
MAMKVLFLLGVVAVAAADQLPSYSYNAPDSMEYSEESTEAKYDFQWAVKDDYSGNDFGHQESRDGDDTQGSYYVQLPDGRLQKVTYYVDGDNGYVADVTYEGEARYDSVESRETPVYAPPRPVYSAPESEESEEEPVYVPPSLPMPLPGLPMPLLGLPMPHLPGLPMPHLPGLPMPLLGLPMLLLQGPLMPRPGPSMEHPSKRSNFHYCTKYLFSVNKY